MDARLTIARQITSAFGGASTARLRPQVGRLPTVRFGRGSETTRPAGSGWEAAWKLSGGEQAEADVYMRRRRERYLSKGQVLVITAALPAPGRGDDDLRHGARVAG